MTSLTIGHALKQSGARLLEVDGRELGVLTVPQARGVQIVLFDNTPGGSGHVLELAEDNPRGCFAKGLIRIDRSITDG